MIKDFKQRLKVVGSSWSKERDKYTKGNKNLMDDDLEYAERDSRKTCHKKLDKVFKKDNIFG